MNEEQNTGQGKPVTNRRTNRHGRNRPVLVTDAATEQTLDVEEQEAASGAPTAEVQTMTEEAPAVKRRPKFFSTVGKKEEIAEAKATDAAAARLARATRAKAAVPGKKETRETKETREPKKPEPKAVVKSAPARSAPPRRGGFKPRHLIGILIYLLVADFIGAYERAFLVSYNLNAQLFSIGSIHVDTAIVVFLLTLVVLLIVLARFDLVPRSLAPAPASTRSQGKTGQGQNTPDTNFGDTSSAPPIKKGVKGKDDDLYQEYRETQRYLQRRERKK